MEKPRIEQVLQAIDALYNIQNAEGKEAASKWLENLQTSVGNLPVFCHCLLFSSYLGCRIEEYLACWLNSLVLLRLLMCLSVFINGIYLDMCVYV